MQNAQRELARDNLGGNGGFQPVWTEWNALRELWSLREEMAKHGVTHAIT